MRALDLTASVVMPAIAAERALEADAIGRGRARVVNAGVHIERTTATTDGLHAISRAVVAGDTERAGVVERHLPGIRALHVIATAVEDEYRLRLLARGERVGQRPAARQARDAVEIQRDVTAAAVDALRHHRA